MDKKLKRFLIKTIGLLLLIHLGYFAYGFFTFKGLAHINIFTEFYRFKFYDDVSISHFFITGLFLLIFLIFLLKNHTKQPYSSTSLLQIGGVLLLISFLSFSFFVSFSFGMNAQLKSELSESEFNKDKSLLNVLHPFLYPSSAYSSQELFNPVHILYPKPYPIIEVVDSTLLVGQYYQLSYKYYSIDTLKMLTADLNQASTLTTSVLGQLGFDQKELLSRIITKNTVNDSTEIIYKGSEVNPRYDTAICVFVENKSLFSPIKGVAIDKQQYKSAVERYKLLYEYKPDSLLSQFQKLDRLFGKYQIENHIVSADLVDDILYYKKTDELPTAIRNNFDRNALADKFNTVDRLFYQPNFMHPDILPIFLSVVFGIWLIGFALFIVVAYAAKKS